MSGRSVYFVASYTLSPDDLKPVFKVMLEYTKYREAACSVAFIDRKKQINFGLLTNT